MPSAKQILQRGVRQALEVYREHPIFVERAVFQGIGFEIGFLQVGGGEGVAVDDQDAVGLQVLHVGAQGGRVHGYQYVHRVTGGENVTRGELNLESADAGKGARRGANLGGIVGESR
jgi:hypothetical protein